MPYAVILMQENYLFRSLAPNQVITQPQSQAVNVAPYRYITPFVHVLTSPDNDIPTAGMGEVQAITFNFLTAAALPTQFDVNPPGTFGDRFYELTNGTVVIDEPFPTGTPPAAGKTFTMSELTDGGLKAITNPGGLLIWRCTNHKSAPTATFRADIYLVCRGE